jgi:hypothetical protein
MTDIRLISIIPPQAVQGISQPPTVQNTGSGSTPGTIESLTPGTTLSGFIINRDAAGNPVLRTENGDVIFSSNFFLKIGSEVVIRVQFQGGETLARILSVNGQPPEIAEKLSSFAGDPEVIVGGHLAQSKTDAPATQAAQAVRGNSAGPQITLSGTLVSTHATAEALPATPAGTQLTFKLVSLNVASPPATPAAPQLAIGGNNPSSVSYAAYAKLAPTPTTPTGQPIAVPIASAQAQPVQNQPTASAVPTPSAPLQIGQTLSGQVFVNEHSGEPLLQTPIGVIRLAPDVKLANGSLVSLEITNIVTPHPLQAAGTTQPSTPFMQLATQWHSVRDIFSLLLGTNSPFGASNAAGGLPSLLSLGAARQDTAAQNTTIAQSIVAGMSAYVAALRSGDIRGWLGKAATAWLEENGHKQLLNKAGGEFAEIARHYANAPPGHWQPLFYPLALFGELHQLRMFVKRDRKEGKEQDQRKKPDGDTRFIVELELTQLGELQLDGFVRRQDKKLEFDLVIRSLQGLSDDIRRDLLVIYNRMGEATGYQGGLTFQSVKNFPVNPMEDIVALHPGSVMA